MNERLPRRYRWLLRRAASEDERDCLLSDIEEEAAERAHQHGEADARRWCRRQARASVGPLLYRRTEGVVRVAWRGSVNTWRGFGKDLKLAFRRLRDAPVFAATCIATLALSIGGNTSVFTLIDRVILKPLPVERPSELYRLGDTYDCCVNSGLPGSFSLFSYDLYTRLQASAPEFAHLAAFQASARSVTIGRPDPGDVGQAFVATFVSGNYFQMLGLAPAAGRLAAPSDDRPGATPVAVISHRVWLQHFGGRQDVIGSSILLNGVAGTIIGVTPESFYGETLRPEAPDVWIPLASEPLLQPAARLREAKGSHWLYIIGRLKPDVSRPVLEAKLTAQLQHWLTSTLELSADEQRRLPEQHIAVVPAAQGVGSLREAVEPSLKLLQAVAAVVLLIACANLANLLLARAAARRTETAVRVALGASRERLIAQFLTESIVLACLGGAAGLLVAYAGARAIIALAFESAANVPIDASPTAMVVLFAFGVSLITALVFGTVPSVIASRSEAMDAVRGGARSTTERRSAFRRSLIALQVALSLVVITCAGLLARSLGNLERQDLGIRPDGLYVAALAPSIATTPAEELASVYARTRERLARIPAVADVGIALYGPMSGDNWASNITVDGQEPSDRIVASWNRVSPGYFATIGTPAIRGRDLDERDRADAPLVTVVNQKFAERFFPGQDPIGRRLGFSSSSGTGAREIEIVGVVGDAKYQDGREAPNPTFFLPFLQPESRTESRSGRVSRSQYAQAVLIRTRGADPALEQDVRRALAEVDRRLIVRTFRPMAEQIAGHFNLERLLARLTLAFGGAALLLACLGIYGVISHAVTRRTREIGIRMAVGATRARVLGTVLKGSVLEVAAGVVVGVPAAVAAGRLFENTLFGVSTADPMVLGAGLGILGVAATIAALLPARRAATMDPVRAPRIE
jgi:predicted permease